MDAAIMLPLLRDVAERAVAEGRKLRLMRERGPMASGVALLKGTVVIVLEPGIPAAEEVRFLIDGLKKIELSGLFLPPAVREALGPQEAGS